MAVAVRTERRLRIVQMQRLQPRSAHYAIELFQRVAEALARADVVSGGEQMAGVEADAEPLVVIAGLEQRGQLLERPSERAACARRVLHMELAAIGLRERLRDDLAGSLDRPAHVPLLRRAGVQHDAARSDSVADSQ